MSAGNTMRAAQPPSAATGAVPAGAKPPGEPAPAGVADSTGGPREPLPLRVRSAPCATVVPPMRATFVGFAPTANHVLAIGSFGGRKAPHSTRTPYHPSIA